MWLYHRVMSPNDADEMANSVDPDQTAPLGAHLRITRMRNRDQYRMSIRGVSGLALEESKMHTFSRI